ncbi:TraB/GumN family protein [Luteibacter yeojuensis]|uniref:TraB/GumN family protein n=1 Tax=Luteibacter yeojuensis TaxID=345309 RepID=A0A7X5TP19_9GAMM|nr:TraB/GumN family protein [Luteibacter yeojuensis]NID14254.1 TraB/GumN family protein [Luteibacter yeojuensis]
MRAHTLPATLAFLCMAWLPAVAVAQTAPTGYIPTLEAVTVSGEQPGPGLWRARRDGHTLLILGSLVPLPGKMTWKTGEIDDALAHSGALIMPPHVEIKPNTGFFGRLALLPSLIGVRKAPDGATLKETVPPDVYARWLAVKARYIGNDRGVERYRPIFAVLELYKSAVKKAGLGKSGDITRSVADLARKHGVRQVPVEYTLLVDDPRAAIKSFKHSTLDDVSCFTQSVDNIDAQLADMTRRANAWATGDIAALRDERSAKQRITCMNAVTEGGVAQRIGLADVPKAVRERWLAAVNATLATDAQAVAIVSIDDLLGKDGYLEALRSRGYTVESPDEAD